MSLAERLLRLVMDEPGIAQAEAARKLNVRYQRLRSVVLDLLRKEKIRRIEEDVYRLYPNNFKKLTKPRLHKKLNRGEEDWVKKRLASHFEESGWKVQVRYGKAHGPDLVASKDGKRWIIEVKGLGRYSAMTKNYFLSVLGEILQRMQDPSAYYGLAFPDHPRYRRLWAELPSMVKDKLSLSAFFVGENIVEVR